MSKKWVIALSVVLGVIGLFVLLCFTLFSLNKVTINYRSSISNITASDKEIVQSGQFNYKNSVFFQKKAVYIKNIEKANPYIEVINIETVFPNKFIVHVKERLEVYKIVENDKTIYLDNTLKVLSIKEGNINDDVIELKAETNGAAVIGEKLDVVGYQDIYSSFVENNRLLQAQRTIIKSLEIKPYHDVNLQKDMFMAQIITDNGQTYNLFNIEYGLKYKVSKMLTIYSTIFETLVGQPINGESEVWTPELLSNAVIDINNFYSSQYEESDCYSKINKK